jgi:hypothetical protein
MKIWNFLAIGHLATEAKKGKNKKDKNLIQNKNYTKKITHVIKSTNLECKKGNGLLDAFVDSGCKLKSNEKGVQSLVQKENYQGNEESIFWQYFMMPMQFPDVGDKNYGDKENCGNDCEQTPLISWGHEKNPKNEAQKAENKRFKKAKNLSKRYIKMNEKILEAQKDNCFKDYGARRLQPRFANYGFNKGIIQVTRQYIQVYMNLDEDKLFGYYSNACGENKEKGLCPPGGIPKPGTGHDGPYDGTNISNPNGPKTCRTVARIMEKRLARMANLSRREYCKVVRKEPWCYEKDGTDKKWNKNTDEEFGNLREMFIKIKDQKDSLENWENRKENKQKAREEWREQRKTEKLAANASSDGEASNKGGNDWKDGVNRYDPDAESESEE